jgi:hypothetical protein
MLRTHGQATREANEWKGGALSARSRRVDGGRRFASRSPLKDEELPQRRGGSSRTGQSGKDLLT